MSNIILSNFPVGPKFNGGAMTTWGIINFFKNKKNIFILILLCDSDQKESPEYKECLRVLKEYEINYKIIFYKKNKKNFFLKLKNFFLSLIFSTPELFFYDQVKIKKDLILELKKIDVDKIFCYHFDCLSICYDLGYETIACLGDLIHEPRIYRRKIINKNYLQNIIFNFVDEYLSFKVMLNMIKASTKVGFYANHYFKKIKKFSSKVEYFRTSIVRPIVKKSYENENFKIKKFLILGDLHGTVSISSFLFLEDFLNENYNYLKNNNINFNIVGGSTLNEVNKNLKKFDIINFYGRSDFIDDHIQFNQFLFVPNTIDLGIRVRIITALSFGLVVISNIANQKGIPELKHNENCLLFKDNSQLIDIIESINNKSINILKIQNNALKTFNKNFYYPEAVKDLFKKID